MSLSPVVIFTLKLLKDASILVPITFVDSDSAVYLFISFVKLGLCVYDRIVSCHVVSDTLSDLALAKIVSLTFLGFNGRWGTYTCQLVAQHGLATIECVFVHVLRCQ